MNKVLQALKNIKRDYCAGRMCPQSVDACKMCDIGIIETALKDKENEEAEIIEVLVNIDKGFYSELGDALIEISKILDKYER